MAHLAPPQYVDSPPASLLRKPDEFLLPMRFQSPPLGDTTLSAEKTVLHLSGASPSVPIPGSSPIPLGGGVFGSPATHNCNDSPGSGAGFQRNTFAFSGIKKELSEAEGDAGFRGSPRAGTVGRTSSVNGRSSAMRVSLSIDIPPAPTMPGHVLRPGSYVCSPSDACFTPSFSGGGQHIDSMDSVWEGMGSVCVLDARPASARSRSHSPLNRPPQKVGMFTEETESSEAGVRPYTPIASGEDVELLDDSNFLVTNAAWMDAHSEEDDVDMEACYTPVGSLAPVTHLAFDQHQNPPRAPRRRNGEDTWRGPPGKIARSASLYDSKDYTEILHQKEMQLGRSLSELHYDGHYQCCDLLGKGSFGEVWSVTHYRTNEYYALKKSNQTFRGSRDRQTFLREIRAMGTIAATCSNHPNIVKYERAWQDKGYFYIVMELCEEGTLRSLIDYNADQQQAMPVEQIQHISQGMMTGLHHIHSANFLHLDLKPDNLFLSSAFGIKIGDFGLVVENGRWEDEEGDKRYLAPELLQGSADFKSDIFSAGLIVYQMLTGQQDLPGNGPAWHALRQPPTAPPQNLVEQIQVQPCSPEHAQLAMQMAQVFFTTTPPSSLSLSLPLSSLSHSNKPNTLVHKAHDACMHAGARAHTKQTHTCQVVACMIDPDPGNRPSTAALISAPPT